VQNLITPIILCGGAGTRLWPVSRESMPKQFVSLVGHQSTFQQVLDRVSNETLFTQPIIITHADFRFVVAEQVRSCGREADIVLEPIRRDSGPAIAVVTEIVRRRQPRALLLVLAADHVIKNREGFETTCREAIPAAVDSRIVTFGVPPSSPATGFGYIRPGPIINDNGVRSVDAFVEKPDVETAARYIAEGYLWNCGNFLFRADVMAEEIARFEPAMAKAVQTALDSSIRDLDFIRLDEQAFASSPKKSIDYAVMERTDRAVVISAELGWSDVGNWNAVWDVLVKDTNGNATEGYVELLETRDSLVHSDGSLLTTVIGCEGMVVVTTSDAVLVMPRARAELVKSLVDSLRAKKHKEATEHRRSYRPWGYYQGVDLGDRYQVKRIVVKPAGRLSLQKHFHRAEHWVVVKGTAEITVGSEVRMVHENESMYIPIGSVHRLCNPGRIPLELIEVQVGSYLGEDDIVRIEDVYRRE
jgi:mannose-1-phosphate guanylyltransferase / mannose-6-phosphate isomerase